MRSAPCHDLNAPCGRDLADLDREIYEDNMQAEYEYELGCWLLGIEPYDWEMHYQQP